MTVVIGLDRTQENARILEEGKRLADQFQTDVDVVHVLSRSDFVDLQRTSISETSDAVDIDEVRSVAADIAEEIAEEVIDEFESTGLVGDASEELVRWAEKRDALYVVIGIRKRSPVGKAVFGSVAQDVLMSSDRPVVAVPLDRSE